MIFYNVMSDGRYHFRFDHHLINNFNTCDRYFKFKHIPDTDDGMVWTGRGWSSAIQVGIWWSRVMELFYREMSFGDVPTASAMQKFAADAWTQKTCRQCRLDEDEHQPMTADHPFDPISMAVDFPKHDPDYYDKFKGGDGALLMALEYYESFAELDHRNWTIIGAEKGFGLKGEVLIGEDHELKVEYTGRPDLVILENASSKVLPLDHKTKDAIPGNADRLFKPHPQTAGYIFACNRMAQDLGLSTKATDKCFIRLAARLRPTDKPRDGVKKPRFKNIYPVYSESELLEWQHDIMAKARRLRYAIINDEFIPRESACHLFYHGCQFRGVCSSPPETRNLVLKSNFTKIKAWSPYNLEDEG